MDSPFTWGWSACDCRSERGVEAPRIKSPRQIQISCSTVFYGKTKRSFEKIETFVQKPVDSRHFRCGPRKAEKCSDKFGHSNCVFLRESDKSTKCLFPL